ncbi:MAG: MutT/nudix family protein [Candidatus Gottesmanbacteria bacterium GW2011_GWC2_39_8]|uniref:MutT/nudix family protein n=1 Tax=Candidatus Gottesmanbacteria bacterium GW2011_GWC2_39_8 TaxID=1618450 RepID=A0A0G0T6J1_9BACT|nr:MAG: MutT/nudix family protein [Candidatus Gottesmanbacteria bacterium GW2011_GWC2_39_8]
MTLQQRHTKREFSAGGIVYRKLKIKNLKLKIENVEWLVVQHSQHKGWVFPKGLIGDKIEGEGKEETAIREVKEEGGVDAKIVSKSLKPVTYYYTWEGQKIFKTVYYYLMEYLSGSEKDHDWEVSDAVWLPTEKVEEKLSFKSDQEAFAEAIKLINSK